MNVVPVHIHFFEKDRYSGYQEDFIKILDKCLVQRAVIFGNEEADETTAACLIAFKKKFPARIFGIPEINIKEKTALKKMHDYVKKNQMSGIKIFPSKCLCYPDNKKMFGLYKKALDLKVPLVFHSGRVPGDMQKYGLVKYAQPIALDEVAGRFPQLQILISHAGNPMFEQTLMIGNRKNIHLDLCGVTGVWRDKFPLLFERFGAQRLLHGGPNHYHGKYLQENIIRMQELLSAAKLSEEEKSMIMGKNAIRIFNLEKD